MRRILLVVCIVALLALVLNAVGGNDGSTAQDPDGPAFTTVSEAAFSLRSTGAEDATSFLVGNFTGNSVRLFFDGAGAVKMIKPDYSTFRGSYSLRQSANGDAILGMAFDDGKETMYTFEIASPEGGFRLRNSAGTAWTFLPAM